MSAFGTKQTIASGKVRWVVTENDLRTVGNELEVLDKITYELLILKQENASVRGKNLLQNYLKKVVKTGF